MDIAIALGAVLTLLSGRSDGEPCFSPTGTTIATQVSADGVVVLTPKYIPGSGLFFDVKEGSLHAHQDCLSVKVPEGDVVVFFPFETFEGQRYDVFGGVTVEGDERAKNVVWTPASASVGGGTNYGERLNIRRADLPGYGEGIAVRYSRAAIGETIRLQFPALYWLKDNVDPGRFAEHGDPNVVFRPTSNPTHDTSDFPPCPPRT